MPGRSVPAPIAPVGTPEFRVDAGSGSSRMFSNSGCVSDASMEASPRVDAAGCGNAVVGTAADNGSVCDAAAAVAAAVADDATPGCVSATSESFSTLRLRRSLRTESVADRLRRCGTNMVAAVGGASGRRRRKWVWSRWTRRLRCGGWGAPLGLDEDDESRDDD